MTRRNGEDSSTVSTLAGRRHVVSFGPICSDSDAGSYSEQVSDEEKHDLHTALSHASGLDSAEMQKQTFFKVRQTRVTPSLQERSLVPRC